jgi:branched-chain amino acid transport system substrate-binding protein
MSKITRRGAVRLAAAATLGAPFVPARAEEKVLTIGMSVPLTGALAQQSRIVRDAAQFAIDEANEKGGVAGYKIGFLLLDDGSPTTGQYDPALAATNDNQRQRHQPGSE